jgi:hypothetical protein
MNCKITVRRSDWKDGEFVGSHEIYTVTVEDGGEKISEEFDDERAAIRALHEWQE